MFEAGPQEWVGDWSGKRARLSPDRVGLVDATTSREFTYADLDARANRCARLLGEYGVTLDQPTDGSSTGTSGPADHEAPAGGRVAVISRNRPAFVDFFFATGKTGGVLAPLSHRLAAAELVEMLNDVDPSLLVVEEPFADLVGDVLDHDDRTFECPVLSLAVDGDHTWERYADALPESDEAVDRDPIPMDAAHLFLHTGGSTGTPKETVITHEAVVWNSVNTITAWGLRDDDLTPMVFPMFHTGGWNVLTVPLFHMGGTVVIAREFDPGEVLRIVDERRASVLVAVPAMLRMLVEHDRWSDVDLSALRFVKSGGGPCRQSVMEAWWDRGVDLSQGYGLTECGPNNFAMTDDWPREKADTVGVPNVHVDARVVDEDGQRLDAGGVGELELRSPHAADRYWRDEADSEATFGDGWISTGDLARVDENGYVSIEGRTKNMFVSGGENVYPTEVEDAISRHPAVDEVVVVPVADDQWGHVGKAVVDGDESMTLEKLEEFLEGKLARFKRPHHLAFVDEMPTSGPSKIDRQALEERFGG